jgi:hypothetical protein
MSTIEKIAVYDARIIQEAPKYAVQKGALSVSVSPFNAISASASQHTYQILVPSLNVFVDRKIDLKTGAYVSMEAVPSQYSSTAYNSGALANTVIKSRTTLAVAEQFSPTSNALYNLNMTSFPSFSEDLLGANSTITFSAGVTLATAAFAATSGDAGATTVHGTYVSGFDFVTSAAVRASLIGTNVTFTSTSRPLSNTITNCQLLAGSTTTVVFTLGSAITTQIAGNFSFQSVTAITQVIDRVEYVRSQSDEGVAVNASQIAKLYMNVPLPLFSSLGSATITLQSAAGQIQTPKLVSTAESLSLPVEVIRPDGTRGYGENSGFLLTRGSFPGCTGPTDNNWYQPIGGPTDLSLCMFPIQSLCTNMTASINDCSVTTNGDTLKEQILLSQTRASLMQRTCTSKFDTYAYAIDDARSMNGSTRTYGSAKDSDIGNGSWQIEFVDPATGTSLPQYGTYTYNGIQVPIINWRPAFIPQGSSLVGKTIQDVNSKNPNVTSVLAASSMTTPLPVMFRFYCSEPLVMSPFLWQDAKEMTEVGLYGCTNIALTLNLQAAGPALGYETLSPPAGFSLQGRRYYCDKLNTIYPTNASIVRNTGLHALFSKINLSNPSTNATSNTGPFISPRLLVTFLTPPPDVTLPMVSTVPYMEFPRYLSPCTIPSGQGSVQINSNTITLSSIPDILAIYVKANSRGQTQQENYIPIERIGVTFDNYSNLCSNFQQEDLYACTVAGGLDMDWQQWKGYTNSTFTTDIPLASQPNSSQLGAMMDLRKSAKVVQMSSGPLLLRMGQDIPLSPGLAPGTLGNFSVQLNITVDNSNGFFDYLGAMSANNNASIIIMAINSGFFETVRGQSAVRKTILNSVDVEAASVQSGVTSTHLRRMVGGQMNGTLLNSEAGTPMNPVQGVSGNGAEADVGPSPPKQRLF